MLSMQTLCPTHRFDIAAHGRRLLYSFILCRVGSVERQSLQRQLREAL